VASPIGQDDEDIRDDLAVLDALRLPGEIYANCCGGTFFTSAFCTAVDGVLSSTVLETAENARQRKHERRAEFEARIAWLRRAAV
jgi:hypothetical protein